MSISDPAGFAEVKRAVEDAFSAAHVEAFLKSLARGGLRVRHFEAVVASGKLGEAAKAQYAALPGGDQGQIREFYLASLEQVEQGLRERYFKLYAYY